MKRKKQEKRTINGRGKANRRRKLKRVAPFKCEIGGKMHLVSVKLRDKRPRYCKRPREYREVRAAQAEPLFQE